MANGYEVIEAACGVEGLEKFRAESCDCVLLDLTLPDVDGIEVCREIRERSRVPIVIVSLRDSKEDERAAREAGADDYVRKPFGVEALLASMESAFERSERPSP